jgi:hypothetical protein
MQRGDGSIHLSGEQIQELSRLLQVFFQTQDNTVKTQIEGFLSKFQSQPEAWKQARVLLTCSESGFVIWFAAATLEGVLNNSWSLIPKSERISLRQFLLQYLSTNFKVLALIRFVHELSNFVDDSKFCWHKACESVCWLC